MRKRIATWSIVFISVLGCRTVTANFPRAISSIELDNGVKITMELNEDIMVFLDPSVSKKITIDYGKRQLTHKSSHDDYNYRIYLLKEKKDTIWVLQEADKCQTATCSFSDEDATFEERYIRVPEDTPKDTLLKIRYKEFAFTIE